MALTAEQDEKLTRIVVQLCARCLGIGAIIGYLGGVATVLFVWVMNK